MPTAQQPKGSPANAPAPVGASPAAPKAVVDGNKVSGTNVAQQPMNAPAPVGASPTVVGGNKSDETNVTQQPKVLLVNAPAPVVTTPTVQGNKPNETGGTQQTKVLAVNAPTPVGTSPASLVAHVQPTGINAPHPQQPSFGPAGQVVEVGTLVVHSDVVVAGNKLNETNGIQQSKGLPGNVPAPVGTTPTVEGNKSVETNATQHLRALLVNAPAPAGTSPPVLVAQPTGINAPHPQQPQLLPVPANGGFVQVGSLVFHSDAVVGGNKPNETNGAQQPKVFPVNAPAQVVTSPIVEGNKLSENHGAQHQMLLPANAPALVGAHPTADTTFVTHNQPTGTNAPHPQQPNLLPANGGFVQVGTVPFYAGAVAPNITHGTQQQIVLPVNAPAPVGTNHTVDIGQSVLVNHGQPTGINALQPQQLPANGGLVQVGTLPLHAGAVVAPNGTQQPMVYLMNAPAPVGTHSTVGTGMNAVVGGNHPIGAIGAAGGHSGVMGGHNVLIGSGHPSSPRSPRTKRKGFGSAFKNLETICHDELEAGFGAVKGWVEKSLGSTEHSESE